MKIQGSEIEITDISIIIPVKNNQSGIEDILKSFFDSQKPEDYPKEIIIVDNNSDIPLHIPAEYQNSGISIKTFECKRLGPAAARNVGVDNALGNWILFVDSDCIFTESTIRGYLCAESGAIAYAGFTDAIGDDSLSRYYIGEEILFAGRKKNKQGKLVPKYLVTANTLVYKPAFDLVGGFNEYFIHAGGEDVDLGFRLSEIGEMRYALDSVVLHNFNDGLKGFYKRFKRYGMGNQILQEIHDIFFFSWSWPKGKKNWFNLFYNRLQVFSTLAGHIQMTYYLKWTKQGNELRHKIQLLKKK